jgi:hypothetical protein
MTNCRSLGQKRPFHHKANRSPASLAAEKQHAEILRSNDRPANANVGALAARAGNNEASRRHCDANAADRDEATTVYGEPRSTIRRCCIK